MIFLLMCLLLSSCTKIIQEVERDVELAVEHVIEEDLKDKT